MYPYIQPQSELNPKLWNGHPELIFHTAHQFQIATQGGSSFLEMMRHVHSRGLPESIETSGANRSGDAIRYGGRGGAIVFLGTVIMGGVFS